MDQDSVSNTKDILLVSEEQLAELSALAMRFCPVACREALRHLKVKGISEIIDSSKMGEEITESHVGSMILVFRWIRWAGFRGIILTLDDPYTIEINMKERIPPTFVRKVLETTPIDET